MAYLKDGEMFGKGGLKFVEFYEKGLAAEEIQLPCFLPYDFPPKYQIEKIYNTLKKRTAKGSQPTAETFADWKNGM